MFDLDDDPDTLRKLMATREIKSFKSVTLQLSPSRGRPRIAPETQEVSCLLPTDVYDRACQQARARDISLSEFIRCAVRAFVR